MIPSKKYHPRKEVIKLNESNKVTFEELTASSKEKHLEEIRQRLVDIINPYFPHKEIKISNSSVGRFK